MNEFQKPNRTPNETNANAFAFFFVSDADEAAADEAAREAMPPFRAPHMLPVASLHPVAPVLPGTWAHMIAEHGPSVVRLTNPMVCYAQDVARYEAKKEKERVQILEFLRADADFFPQFLRDILDGKRILPEEEGGV